MKETSNKAQLFSPIQQLKVRVDYHTGLFFFLFLPLINYLKVDVGYYIL